MSDIAIISTGGTFNKIYNPISGALDIDENSHGVEEISTAWGIDPKVINIISKDSLDITHEDRRELLRTIQSCTQNKIIVIHGTDTMDISADFIDKNIENRCIVFTGSMIPYSIDTIEATANLVSAFGFLQADTADGVYISMHGIIMPHHKVTKDRIQGRFVVKD